MTSKLTLLALTALTLGSSAFADTTTSMDGDQAIGQIINMIPLEIRTNAFLGKTSQGRECRLDIVLTNSNPEMLAVGISVDDGEPTNMLVEKSNSVRKIYSTTSTSAVASLENLGNPGWKLTVQVPDLSNKPKRIVTIQGNRGTADCAIDTNVSDN